MTVGTISLFAVINESTVVKDAAVQACVNALRVQLARDFAPNWGIRADCAFFPSRVAPRGWPQLVILDDSDQADALGYHELTADGLPLGKVFAKSDLLAGTSWTVTASHELLEMIVDPLCNLTAEADNPDNSVTMYAYEVCDAVEADSLGYTINGVLLSDFVLPRWFEPGGAGGKFDLLGHVQQPFQIAPGGYISILKLPGDAEWTQITADRRVGGPAPLRGSRRDRRKLTDCYWRRSERKRAA